MAEQNRGVSEGTRNQRHESRTSSTFMEFVRDLAKQGNFSEEEAVRSAACVLTHLEQRITGEEARDLESQLPMKLVEILSEANRPKEGGPIYKFSRDDFVNAVAQDLNCDHGKAESIIRAVFTTVRGKITEGEADDVTTQLPKDLQSLWARPV